MKWFLFGLILLPCTVLAKTPSFDACFDDAANKYSVDPRILRAIAQTESSMRPNAMGPPNKNGTYDIGLMQINSMHLKRLSKQGITEKKLMNACTSIYVGAWILAENIARYGRTWNAVGAYNAKSPHLREKYVQKIKQALVMYE